MIIIPISNNSRTLAERIASAYPTATLVAYKDFSESTFQKAEQLIFIGALGICVRTIAPFATDKHTDPAVVCIDSTGRFVISVLSGHIGGANELTRDLAHYLGAEPVITTQSDNTQLWALDTLPRQFDWSWQAAKSNAAIAAFVNQEPTALLLDIRDRGTDYLERTAPAHVKIYYRFEEIPQADYALLIAVTPYRYETTINTLTYIPKVLHVGLGCRKGMQGDPVAFQAQLEETLQTHRLYPEAIADLNSIDLKKEEPMLNALATEVMHRPFQTFSAEELKTIEVPNPSAKVEAVADSPSVS